MCVCLSVCACVCVCMCVFAMQLGVTKSLSETGEEGSLVHLIVAGIVYSAEVTRNSSHDS